MGGSTYRCVFTMEHSVRRDNEEELRPFDDPSPRAVSW